MMKGCLSFFTLASAAFRANSVQVVAKHGGASGVVGNQEKALIF
jgi:hypothetical protein